MNYRQVTRRLRKIGCEFVRQAPGSHEIWWNPPIPYEHLFGVTRATFAAVESLRNGERVLIDARGNGW